jgi:hypothetical protein
MGATARTTPTLHHHILPTLSHRRTVHPLPSSTLNLTLSRCLD